MSDTVKTFAELLRQFAFSIDIVSESTFNRVREHVVEYMKNELEAAYFGLMTRSVINGQPGLQTTWSTEQGSAITIRNGEGYTQQVSLAFDQRRPLWVVSRDGTPLLEVSDPSGYVDLWSDTVDRRRVLGVDRSRRSDPRRPEGAGDARRGDRGPDRTAGCE